MSTITRWNPIREANAMSNFMNRLMQETMRPSRMLESYEGVTGALALDVVEENGRYVVTTSLPGVKADDIKVNLHDDLLTIEAEIPTKTTEKTEEGNGPKVLLQERSWGKFSRSIRLPQPVNSENVSAEFENGVLTLTLPKADHVLPRTIPVKVLGSHN